MPMCINCGSDKVERQGDAFTCHKCQFQWDVAFEQANKVYLRAQGRQPATSVLETATASGVVTTPSPLSGEVAVTTAQRIGDNTAPADEPEKPTADAVSSASSTVVPESQPQSNTKSKKG